MWQEIRLRQMALFQNAAIGNEHQIDGHGANAVTPEQVKTEREKKIFILLRFMFF